MSKQDNLRIVVVGGNSAGHSIPALTFARRHYPEMNIIFFSGATKIDEKILSFYAVAYCYFFSAIHFPERKIWRYPRFVFEILICFFRAFFYLVSLRPKEVISMGGYLSIPLVLAARLARIPVTLFELNAEPGRAIKILTPFADRVYTCFETAKDFFPRSKIQLASYPIRFSEEDRWEQNSALDEFNLKGGKKTVLILGGSQGSYFINDCMIHFLSQDPSYISDLNIIHQTGMQDLGRVKKFYEKFRHASVSVFSFTNNLSSAYSAADIIICRAGAGTLFEIIFFQKTALVIPLEASTTNHQRANALALQKTHPQLIHMISQKDIVADKNVFTFSIMKLLANHLV